MLPLLETGCCAPPRRGKIRELQQSKAQTIADVLGEEGFARGLTTTDLDYLFAED